MGFFISLAKSCPSLRALYIPTRVSFAGRHSGCQFPSPLSQATARTLYTPSLPLFLTFPFFFSLSWAWIQFSDGLRLCI